jgi:hypothetical protein
MNLQLDKPPKDAKALREELHKHVDDLPEGDLQAVNKVLGHLVIDRLVGELNDAFDEDRRAGRLTPERIQAAIAAHRAKHPYK